MPVTWASSKLHIDCLGEARFLDRCHTSSDDTAINTARACAALASEAIRFDLHAMLASLSEEVGAWLDHATFAAKLDCDHVLHRIVHRLLLRFYHVSRSVLVHALSMVWTRLC